MPHQHIHTFLENGGSGLSKLIHEGGGDISEYNERESLPTFAKFITFWEVEKSSLIKLLVLLYVER